jgi:argininosuccinate synthase
MIAHGCTAAGNDQVRFEVALRTLAPDLEIFAPVRDQAFKRQEELDYLVARKLPVPPHGAAYSINRGLWGVTIGGKETLTSSRAAFRTPRGCCRRTRSTSPRACRSTTPSPSRRAAPSASTARR